MTESCPTVLLIGTGHWSNPGLDYRSTAHDDMLAPGHQQEIAGCVARLARFQPTKVGLEIVRSMEDEWNADYRAFNAGDFALTANERHQLGFRLAAASGLGRIHAIDWHNPEQAIGWDEAIAFAQKHDQQSLISAWFGSSEPDTKPLERKSVHDQLLAHNDPASLPASHRLYLDMALIGRGDDYVGAEVILRWYERNMRMFVNIARLVERPNDRVAIIVGSGHLPLLTHFLDGTTTIRVEYAGAYLRLSAS